MGTPNHINLQGIEKFLSEIQQNPEKKKRVQVIEGEWIFGGEPFQFQGEIRFEKGTTLFSSDSPSFMGGWGNLPGPLHYCFFGVASCYTAVFVTIATQMGIHLEEVRTRVEGEINFGVVFGLEEGPVVEGVRIFLRVKSSSPREKIQVAEELAKKRCPAVYTLTHSVPLTTELSFIE